MTTTIEPKPVAETTVGSTERALVLGDLSHLGEQDRIVYYRQVCESLGLNPLTRPFDYLRLSGKLVLYARRDATDQLRRLHQISTEVVSRLQDGDMLIVHVRASTPDGRRDDDFGVVSLSGLKGEVLANAVMKAITKAKRRVTLSICGLGWLDETEVEDIPQDQAQPDPDDLLRQIASAQSIEDLDRIAEAVRSGEWRGKARDALRAAWKVARERLLALK